MAGTHPIIVGPTMRLHGWSELLLDVGISARGKKLTGESLIIHLEPLRLSALAGTRWHVRKPHIAR